MAEEDELSTSQKREELVRGIVSAPSDAVEKAYDELGASLASSAGGALGAAAGVAGGGPGGGIVGGVGGSKAVVRRPRRHADSEREHQVQADKGRRRKPSPRLCRGRWHLLGNLNMSTSAAGEREVTRGY